MIPTIKVPTFTMTLPVTHREITFRPFLVKEEKMLIMASESGDVSDIMNTVGDIVSSCTFEKVNIKTDPLFEVQYAFLQIRGKSIGELIEFVLSCGECEHKLDSTLSIDQFEMKTYPEHDKKVELGPDFGVIMKYPTFEHFRYLYQSDETDAVFRVVSECIETIYQGDEVFTVTPKTPATEVLEFVENLTPAQFDKLEEFFVTMPLLQHIVEYTCPSCGVQNITPIDGINNFFG